MLSSYTRVIIGERYQSETTTVAYEDMANPRRVGTVVEHRAGEFRVMWDDLRAGGVGSRPVGDLPRRTLAAQRVRADLSELRR